MLPLLCAILKKAELVKLWVLTVGIFEFEIELINGGNIYVNSQSLQKLFPFF